MILLGGGIEMRQCLFGMACRGRSILLLSFGDRRLQMSDAFRDVRVCFRLFSSFSMFKACFSMLYENIRMALLAMFNSFFGMADRLGEVILSAGNSGSGKSRDRKASNQSKSSAIHVSTPVALPQFMGQMFGDCPISTVARGCVGFGTRGVMSDRGRQLRF
jgi:hypothetical protein